MKMNEKILKQIVETKYLSVENTHRYRAILRIFYENYEKLRYWMYQEEVYEEITRYEEFKEYGFEQCQQDLSALVDWKNLLTVQDTRKVTLIEEFKNKNFRYQMSPYSVEIERLVKRLENLEIEGASLEPTLIERIKKHIIKLEEISTKDVNKVGIWWNDLSNDFIRLNINYQDFIRDLNSIKAEEMIKTKEFLVFKDKLIVYLRTFIKNLQKNLGVIEAYIKEIDNEKLDIIFDKVYEYEMLVPRIDSENSEEKIKEKLRGIWKSIENWFIDSDLNSSESSKLFDTTSEIIRKITRYALNISELNSLGANRKEEYAKISKIFLKCKDIQEAHRLSALVFGIEKTIHLKGEFERKTDSNNIGVYEELPEKVIVSPRIRTYKEKMIKSVMKDNSEEKARIKKEALEKTKRDRVILDKLIKDNKIDTRELPVLNSETRAILLEWISKAMEHKEFIGKTDDGRNYSLIIHKDVELSKIKCIDGDLLMHPLEIIFDDRSQNE